MRILELGCGDLKDANNMQGKVIAIDKKIVCKPAHNVTAIEADYFDIQLEGDFDLIYSNYSLCFNTKVKIEDRLPKILAHLKPGGIFLVRDFHTEDKVVKKRTNIHAPWFFDLVKKYVGPITVSDEKIFEAEHSHEHHIFSLKAKKSK
ncbi:MAG: methyltransferase domain-containing protein [Patescibacteria group bacterium]|nr:class I SAM-dependent methyltransferase [Patescibacteria group bacterium]